ncbi:MAG: hypothetical protein J1E04_03245 [Alistipes sp.]|nr:hypothetical protein [Alistipes sp.]
MKNTLFTNAAAAALTILTLSCCNKKEESPKTAEAPTIEWAANPDFAVMEISDQMDIDIRIRAEAGIRDFVVDVDSHAISPAISLFTTDGTSRMDLINDSKLIAMLAAFNIGLPAGEQLQNKTDVLFTLSSLVPMISDISGERDHDTNHIFTLRMTDNENRTLSKSLIFHYSYIQ